ncbi:MAG: autotransporter domain-containing protein [Microvirga sp.]|nr:autotransporter domain-containing protein [Microvirga sp.]
MIDASRRRHARALLAAALLGSTSSLTLSQTALAQMVADGTGNFTTSGTFAPTPPYSANGGSDTTPTITIGSTTNLTYSDGSTLFQINANNYTVSIEAGAKIINTGLGSIFNSTVGGSGTRYDIAGEIQGSRDIVSVASAGSPRWYITLNGTLRNTTANFPILRGEGGADTLLMNAGSLIQTNGGGVDFRGGNDQLIYNGGAFSGVNSISFGEGDDLLALNASLTSSPLMRGGSGMDTVRLAVSGSFALDALDGDWERIYMRGASWTLTGKTASTFTSGVELESGVLTFDVTDDATIAGAISGSAELTKTGAAALTLSGANTYSGTFTIDAGKVFMTGAASGVTGQTNVRNSGELIVSSHLGGSIDVAGGGRLSGVGTLGRTTISGGGFVAPGASIGTLTVDGDFTMKPGSVYEVEVDPVGSASDLITVNGSAYLAGTVRHVGLPGEYRAGSEYTILTATGGFHGTRFDDVASAYAFLDPRLSYTPHDVRLSLERNETTFPSVGQTSNQKGAGGALESLGAGNALYDSFVTLNAPQARGALDQLSGDVHASGAATFFGSAGQVQGVVGQRSQGAFQSAGGPPQDSYASFGSYAERGVAPGATSWGRVFGSWGRADGDGNAAAIRREESGFLVGADAVIGGTGHLGAYAGYGRSRFNAPSRASSGSSDNYHVGVYGGVEHGALRLSGGAGYSWHEVETTRRVAFPGFANELKASYDAHTMQVFGEAGYRMSFGAVSLEPFVGLAHVHVSTGAFTERGGAAALRGAAGDASTTFSTLGLRAFAQFDLGGMEATIRGMAGWRHAFGDLRDTTRLSFASGGSSFVATGAPRSREAAIVEAGIDLAIAPGATLGFTYDGQYGRRGSEHGVNAQLRVSF